MFEWLSCNNNKKKQQTQFAKYDKVTSNDEISRFIINTIFTVDGQVLVFSLGKR